MCNVQRPGAILLIDPEGRGSITETTAHWYVSTQYIQDCIEKDEQLNLEDYRLNPEVAPRHSTRLSKNRESSPGHLGGRVPYTAEDDAAILSYVSKHKADVGGNRLWQEMEKQRVTSHTWQSMKYRYRVRLVKNQSEVMEVATTEEEAKAVEGESKMEENQERDAEKPSSAEDAVSPQTNSTDSDQTQIEAQCKPPESIQPEILEAQTSICPQGKEEPVSPQTDKQPAENTPVETVESKMSSQPEEPCLDPPTDAQPISAESSEAEKDDQQTNVSPQKESVPEVSPQAQAKALLTTSSRRKLKEKQKASPRLEQPQRRVTRRQLQLEESSSPEPCSKKLRSLSSSAKQPSSPQPSKKTKSADESTPQKDTTVDQPPSRKAKEKSAALEEAEGQQEENTQAVISETAQADTESNSGPRGGEKKKEKRKLGILELAAKEFEDESESDDDEAPDLQNPTETATKQTTSTDPASSTKSVPERGLEHQENVQETPASSSNCPPPLGRPDAAAAERNRTDGAATEPAATRAAAASKAHLFIFESESQEEASQSVIGNNIAAPANPQQTVNEDAAFSMTQEELLENTQLIRELMMETNQDLVSVTKALLRTSGDFSVARDLLLDPSSVPGPFWIHDDDALLLSGDPVMLQQLQQKYGEVNVAKRIMFLEV